MSKNWKRTLSLCLAAALAIMGSGCRRHNAEYRLAAGGAQGLYYACGEAVASAVSEAVRGMRIVPLETAGSEENLRLLQNGEADLALMQSDVAAGAEQAEPGTLLGLAALYTESLQIVATQKSGITSVTEMRGKRVSIGAEGSGTQEMALAVLEACGVELRDVQARALSLEESARALREGQLDAYFILSGLPNAATAALAEEQDLTFVPLREETIAALTAEHSYWQAGELEAGAYGLQTEKTPTLCVKALLVSSDNLSEADAKKIMAALAEAGNALPVSWKNEDPLTETEIFEGMTVPVHPGAQAYFAPEEEQ